MNNNIEKAKEIISSRRKKTNCFSFYNEILNWIEEDKVDIHLINNNLFLFLKNQGFYKLYYYVDDFNQISLCKDLLEKYQLKSDISLEFTTKNDINKEEVTKIVEETGFEFYKEYARVISAPATFKPTTAKTDFLASIEDKEELLEIMYKEFDVITDYLPTEKELIDLIKKKSIIIQKINNQIVFIQIYEYQKGTLYSRMTWIAKEYRKPKFTIGFYEYMYVYLEQLKIEDWSKIRTFGWIDKANKNFKINLKFGAKTDGTTCTIFLYKGKE